MEKGNYGYIDFTKKRRLQNSVIMFLIAAIIFVLGLLLNKFSKNNIFTIFSVLMVLPASKNLVNYIVIAPFKTASLELYDKLNNLISNDMKVLSDMVISSSEKVMGLSFIVISGHSIAAFVAREKEDALYIETYLKRAIKNIGLPYNIKIYSDENIFLQRINEFVELDNASNKKNNDMTNKEILNDNTNDDQKNKQSREENELESYLLSLIV